MAAACSRAASRRPHCPLGPPPSNHEDAANYTHYRTRFASVAENAGVNSGSGTAMFYSFVDGLTHFLMWDTEAFWSQPLDSQTAMINWITADLAAANAARATVPWVVRAASDRAHVDEGGARRGARTRRMHYPRSPRLFPSPFLAVVRTQGAVDG